MTEIFNFENHQIRFVGTADLPWWVAADVCAVLEIANVTQKIQTLDDDERSMFNIGRQGKAWCINESGLYSLILTSRKPQAKRFKKWVTSEVLPSIRKTGSYSVKQEYPINRQLTLEEMMMLADVGKEAAINCGVNAQLAESIKIDSLIQVAPSAKFVLEPQKKAIASSNPLEEVAVTPTVIGERLAKRLSIEKISARTVNKKLLMLGYQEAITRIKSNGKETLDYYKPTEKAINGGFAQIEMSTYSSKGEAGTKYQCRWFRSIVDVLAHNWER